MIESVACQRTPEFIEEIWSRALVGAVSLSEYSVLWARDVESAWLANADLAVLAAAHAAIDAHLRFELHAAPSRSFGQLLQEIGLPKELHERVERLRKARNRWVHVQAPGEDDYLQLRPEEVRAELSCEATEALETMVLVFCHNSWV